MKYIAVLTYRDPDEAATGYVSPLKGKTFTGEGATDHEAIMAAYEPIRKDVMNHSKLIVHVYSNEVSPANSVYRTTMSKYMIDTE